MKHSNIVGGSTAKRVMECPGSVKLVAQMPPKPSSQYADEGTLLHNAIADYFDSGVAPHELIGRTFEKQALTQELFDDKMLPAIQALDALDPDNKMWYAVETLVSFGNLLPDVFGSTDFLGRIDDTAYVVDWKFGDGVRVDATENPQLMFYAAASMRTPSVDWVFKDATKIKCVIIQPRYGVSEWETTPARIAQFEKDLVKAVKKAQKPDAKLTAGDHCRWCAAKPICPIMTGAVDRALRTPLENLPADAIGAYLKNADLLEEWIKSIRALAIQMMENNVTVPGYKLVAKRGVRQWVDENAAVKVLAKLVPEKELVETTVLSPAKVEKVLKKHKVELPEGLIVSISSGTTMASEDDPRPAVMQIGQQLTAALSKLV
jgi:hypothetical protein